MSIDYWLWTCSVCPCIWGYSAKIILWVVNRYEESSSKFKLQLCNGEKLHMMMVVHKTANCRVGINILVGGSQDSALSAIGRTHCGIAPIALSYIPPEKHRTGLSLWLWFSILVVACSALTMWECSKMLCETKDLLWQHYWQRATQSLKLMRNRLRKDST